MVLNDHSFYMTLEKLNKKLFDGDQEKAYAADISCSVGNSLIQFKLQDLTEYSVLEKNISPNESAYIQAELGFEVIDFDGEKIFRGRKKGLELYGLLKSDITREIFLFSCGEFQPRRFQIFLEGSLKY